VPDRAATKAIFVREFHWQRPQSKFGFGAHPAPGPQQFPRDFIAAAIAAGAATAATPKGD
jgi:hypothetical protein